MIVKMSFFWVVTPHGPICSYLSHEDRENISVKRYLSMRPHGATTQNTSIALHGWVTYNSISRYNCHISSAHTVSVFLPFSQVSV
jgi:hypothetical protein